MTVPRPGHSAQRSCAVGLNPCAVVDPKMLASTLCVCAVEIRDTFLDSSLAERVTANLDLLTYPFWSSHRRCNGVLFDPGSISNHQGRFAEEADTHDLGNGATRDRSEQVCLRSRSRRRRFVIFGPLAEVYAALPERLPLLLKRTLPATGIRPASEYNRVGGETAASDCSLSAVHRKDVRLACENWSAEVFRTFCIETFAERRVFSSVFFSYQRRRTLWRVLERCRPFRRMQDYGQRLP